MSISVILITLNEEDKLAGCLESVSWADEVVLVDSGSTDRTMEIAREKGAKVFERKFDNFSSQKNFAVEKAGGEWILSLDADEKVSARLFGEIKEAVLDTRYDGYYIPRLNVIFGREMRFGGHQGDRHLRLFRKARGRFTSPIHERVELDGTAGELVNPLIHYSTAEIKEYMEKLRLYTDLEAGFLVSSGRRIPRHYMFSKPAAVFIKRYFLEKGFLDGWAGFEFYALSAYYEFVKYSKYFRLKARGQGQKGTK